MMHILCCIISGGKKNCHKRKLSTILKTDAQISQRLTLDDTYMFLINI